MIPNDTPTDILTTRFHGLDTLDAIKEKVTIIRPDDGTLIHTPRFLIREKVTQILNGLYIPTHTDLEIILQLVQAARAHSAMSYPNAQAYLEGLYTESENLLKRIYPPICLTGPAGVGKTSLTKALERVFPGKLDMGLGQGHGSVPIESLWRAEVEGRTSAASMLASLVRAETGNANRRPEKITSLCAKAAFKRGVSLLVLDELQFLTQSSTANTSVTKCLYQFSYVGLPLIFVANYSLCRLLQKRSEQDRQRLLSRPLILLPSTPESADWENYLMALQVALGDSLQMDLLACRDIIHQFTAGLKRLMVQLLALAYELAWENSRNRVTLDDLRAAHDDPQYTTGRDQVTTMLRPYSRAFKEYECPFPLPKVAAAALIEMQTQKRLEHLAQAIQINTLPPQERKELESKLTPQAPKRPRRPKISAQTLQQNHLARQKVNA